tara:strand:+ start:645 stop:872 length:228 start_codon:yes stop_codon:yes gene_type:complete
MNREDIIRMAREACDKDKVDAWHNKFWTVTQEELDRFAALVADAEREKFCATLRQLQDVYSLQSDVSGLLARSNQ